MNNEPETIQPYKTLTPICPHCKRYPCYVGMQVAFFGPGMPAGVFMCGDSAHDGCRKILSISPLPVMQQQERASEERLIMMPGIVR